MAYDESKSLVQGQVELPYLELQQRLYRLEQETREQTQKFQDYRRSVARVLLGSLALLFGITGLLMAQSAISSTPPLTYSGYLEEDGKPVDGKRGVVVTLYDAATGGAAQCSVGTATDPLSIIFVKGRFKIPLPSDCQIKVQQNPNLWIEVQVKDANNNLQTLARTRLGTVPYAQKSYIIERNGKIYSVGGVFVGPAKDTQGNPLKIDGKVNRGWTGMKAFCEVSYGKEAHLCSEEELLRSLQMGLFQSRGSFWIAGAAFSRGKMCNSWTTNDPRERAGMFSSAWPRFAFVGVGCHRRFQVACCK